MFLISNGVTQTLDSDLDADSDCDSVPGSDFESIPATIDDTTALSFRFSRTLPVTWTSTVTEKWIFDCQVELTPPVIPPPDPPYIVAVSRPPPVQPPQGPQSAPIDTKTHFPYFVQPQLFLGTIVHLPSVLSPCSQPSMKFILLGDDAISSTADVPLVDIDPYDPGPLQSAKPTTMSIHPRYASQSKFPIFGCIVPTRDMVELSNPMKVCA